MRRWTILGFLLITLSVSAGCATTTARCCCCAGCRMPATTSAPSRAAAETRDVTRGLIAYYPFDGDAADASGRGNDGQASGDVSYVPGVRGKAVRFGGVDHPGHIRIPDSDKLRFSNAMSIAFWLKVEGDASQTWMDGSGRKVPLAGQVVVAKSGDRTGFVLKRGHEAPDVRGMDITAHAHSDHPAGVASQEAVPAGTWVHVVLVAGEGGTRLYQGGEPVGLNAARINFAEVNGEDLYVGIQAGKGSILPWWGPLHGAVDELRIYDRELSPGEIKALAKRG